MEVIKIDHIERNTYVKRVEEFKASIEQQLNSIKKAKNSIKSNYWRLISKCHKTLEKSTGEERQTSETNLSEESVKTCYETIKIDPLAFYIPYNIDRKHFGIYLIKDKITSTFTSFLMTFKPLEKAIKDTNVYIKEIHLLFEVVWNVFLSWIYWHEFSHHLVEIIIDLNNGEYPIKDFIAEENFCEYNSFEIISNQDYNYYTINRILGLKRPSIIQGIRRARKINSTTKLGTNLKNATLNAIYHHFNRENDPIYKPQIQQSMTQIKKEHDKLLKLLYKQLNGKLPINLNDYLKLKGRIYVI